MSGHAGEPQTVPTSGGEKEESSAGDIGADGGTSEGKEDPINEAVTQVTGVRDLSAGQPSSHNVDSAGEIAAMKTTASEATPPTAKAGAPGSPAVAGNEEEPIANIADDLDRSQAGEDERSESEISLDAAAAEGGQAGDGGLGEASQKARKNILGALMPAAACLVDDPAAEVRGTAAVSLGEMLRLMVGFEDYVAAHGASRAGAAENGAGESGGSRGGARSRSSSGSENDSMATCCCVTGEGDKCDDGSANFSGFEGRGELGIVGGVGGEAGDRGRVCHGKVLQVAMAAAAAAAAAADMAAEAAMAAELMDLAGFDAPENRPDGDGNEELGTSGHGNESPEGPRLPFAKHDDDAGEDAGGGSESSWLGDSGEQAEELYELTEAAVFETAEGEEDSARALAPGSSGETNYQLAESMFVGVSGDDHSSGDGTPSDIVENEDGAMTEPSRNTDALETEAAKTPMRSARPLSASAAPYLPTMAVRDAVGTDASTASGGQDSSTSQDSLPSSPPLVTTTGRSGDGMEAAADDVQGQHHLAGESGQGQQQVEEQSTSSSQGSLPDSRATAPKSPGDTNYQTGNETAEATAVAFGDGGNASSDDEGYETGTSSAGGACSVDAINGEQPSPDDSDNPNNLDPAEFVEIYNPSSDPLIVLVARLLLDTNAHVACTMLQALRPAWVPELGPGPCPQPAVCGGDGKGEGAGTSDSAAVGGDAVAGEAIYRRTKTLFGH